MGRSWILPALLLLMVPACGRGSDADEGAPPPPPRWRSHQHRTTTPAPPPPARRTEGWEARPERPVYARRPVTRPAPASPTAAPSGQESPAPREAAARQAPPPRPAAAMSVEEAADIVVRMARGQADPAEQRRLEAWLAGARAGGEESHAGKEESPAAARGGRLRR